MMKTEKYFLLFLAGFIILALLYLFMKNAGSDIGVTAEPLTKENQQQTRMLSFDTKTTGSMESGDALVELTPVIVNGRRIEVKFKINTHSVKLSQFDLEQITTLKYSGKVLKPVKASSIGGHHSTGTIVFDTEKENISNFTIRIKGIPSVEDRVYEWKVG
jgi:DNA polymerase III epsilon subunit-like protein